jgi:hypothetical protein
MANDDKLTLDQARHQSEKLRTVASNDRLDAQSETVFQTESNDAPQPFYESEALMIVDFNRIFIQVLIGNMPSVIWERPDKYVIFSYENFHKQFSYVQIVDLFGSNRASVKATKRWLDSHRKRDCPGIKFWPSTSAIDPDDPQNKLFNIWRGWVTKPIEHKVKWKIIFRWIYVDICNKNRRKARHLLGLYAHMLQKPEEKPSFGIALRGDEEGTGKSMLITQMRKIVGQENSFATSDPENIFGKNNPGMNGCILLHLEEVEWAMYRRYAHKLRDLFTTSTLPINDKWEKQIEQNNFTRINITGNAEHIMHVSRTRRRLSIFDVAPTHIGDTDYFAHVKQTFDTGGREAVTWKLLNWNISHFNPFKPLHTEELDEQKALSLAPIDQFWLEVCLEELQLPYDEVIKTQDGKEISYKLIVEKLVWCFNDWNKGQRPISNKAFGRHFRKIVPPMRPAHDVKFQPAGINRQFNCFEIPTSEECRAFFVARQGWKFKNWTQVGKFEQLYVDKAFWYNGW